MGSIKVWIIYVSGKSGSLLLSWIASIQLLFLEWISGSTHMREKSSTDNGYPNLASVYSLRNVLNSSCINLVNKIASSCCSICCVWFLFRGIMNSVCSIISQPWIFIKYTVLYIYFSLMTFIPVSNFFLLRP